MTLPGCAEAESSFVDVIDGRLDPAASVRVHAHIEACEACRARAALWRGLVPALRALAPEPPAAMAARRMQIEIERQLAEQPARPPQPRWRWRWRWAPMALGLAGAAAVVALRLHPHAPTPAAGAAAASYAVVARASGALTSDGRVLLPAMPVPAGATLALAAGGSAELALARGTTVRIDGPARLALTGGAAAVAIRLDDGRVTAAVAHRLAGETFAVLTKDLRVEVRGTRFSVATGSARPAGSRLAVDEGRVAVQFADGRTRFVSAGESADSSDPDAPVLAPPAPAAGQPFPLADQPAPALPPTGRLTTCASALRVCKETTALARARMRASEPSGALRVLSERRAATFELDARCGGDGLGACQDELGYLRAEALNQAGRLDDAVDAYRGLDRRGAPPVMRQNALYAAAQIERRRGRNGDAQADYERALGAAPRGALREEALVGAMETAEAAGDLSRAGALARRYLREFPAGLGARTAARLAGAGGH